jgi:REP element-mobilizing transposase RayT
MPKPRYAQVSLSDTPYYHCVSRCVRRAFLCGRDRVTGRCFEHRKQWIVDKLHTMIECFAIDLCAYAVMSNHYHVVLHVDRDRAVGWSLTEVIVRWQRLFNGNRLSQRYLKGNHLSPAERRLLEEQVATWRERLTSISWFMRVLNESIARRANAEEACTGRFWEGRFKSQALLDEAALMACMAYVDLNPVRAGVADTPEQSDHTSIQRRIEQAVHAFLPNHPNQQTKGLMPFAGNPRKDRPEGLPFRLTDYLELVDWSGRMLRDDKRGIIDESLPDILSRLEIEPKHWLYLNRHFESRFKGLVGGAFKLKKACRKLGYVRVPGLRACEQFFASG